MDNTQEKYKSVLKTYRAAQDEANIKKEIEKILQEDFATNNTLEVKKFLHGTIDLTSLSGTDTEEKIAALVDLANSFDGQDPTTPNVAAICVYPNFVGTVRDLLTTSEVRIASVSGAFPASQSFIEVKIAETALAVSAGAEEIDIVLNMGAFLSGNLEAAATEIEEQKAATRDGHLKVILETGALKTPERIRDASILALYSGADFLKTSTGKEYPGATLEAAYTMCQVIKEYYEKHGERRGIKISGGVRKSEEAIKYYTLIKRILGEEWLTPELFRIGASSLVESLREEIQ